MLRAFASLLILFTAAILPGAASAENIIRAHGISTFGELKYGPDFEHLDYVNPDAPKGGEISSWAQGTFDSMHPYVVKGTSANSSSIFFEPLMTGVADEPDALYGLLAEQIEYPENRQWATFYLRPEARFSDGTPVTAEDVVFTFEILRDKGIPSLQTLFADFESVEALGPLKVKFTFRDGAETRELPMMAAGLPVFSKADWADRDFAQSTLQPGLGSGPYVLEEMDTGRRLVYRRNPDYWGAHLPINRGRNNFDRIRYEYFADGAAAFEAFKGGNYTFRNENSSKSWATQYNFPALNKGWVKKAELPNGSIGAAQGFFFNLRKPRFQDVRVRQAIEMMFNFEWSNETLFFGLYDRVTSFWGNSPLEAKGMPSEAELALLAPYRDQLPESVFTDPAVIPTKSAPRQTDRRNLRAAGKLLDAAGWPVVDGMRRNAEGETLKLEFLSYSQAFDRIINPYVENLKQLGIDASLKRVDVSRYIELRRSFDFDITTATYGNSLTPDLGLRQRWNSQNAMVPSRNIAGLQHPVVDALVEQALAAKTREELTTVINALDRVLRALHIWVPQWSKQVHTVAYLNIYDYPEQLPPYALGAFDFWWLNSERAEALKAEGAY